MSDFGVVSLRSDDEQADAQPMVNAIGRLIINCGTLETYCKEGICRLEKEVQKQNEFCNYKWYDRSNKLIKLIKDKVHEDRHRHKFIEVIKKTQDLMTKYRNSVAHGMVAEQNRQIAIFDSRFCVSETGELDTVRKEAILVEDINKRINESADLLDAWVDLWSRVKFINADS